MAVEIQDFLKDPTPGLPDLAGKLIKENPGLQIGLEIAQTVLKLERILTLPDLINGIQVKIATTFSGSRPVRRIDPDQLNRFLQTASNSAYYGGNVYFMRHPELDKDAHLTPVSIAETVGTGLGLLYATQNMQNPVTGIEVQSFPDSASAQAAALLSRIIGVRMDYIGLASLNGDEKVRRSLISSIISSASKGNRFLICMASGEDMSAASRETKTREAAIPLGGLFVSSPSFRVSEVFTNGFYFGENQ